MDDCATITPRAMPIAKAIPRKSFALRAEVLLTLRKHGAAPHVSRPSSGGAMRRCRGSGYDLIHQVSPAPTLPLEHTQ
jgi:hypothetical protein